VTFAVPYTDYVPRLVSVEHVAANADCAMTAMASIRPDIRYFADPIAFRGSIRITLPAARLDQIRVTVAPARCAGKTTYRIRRFEDAAELPATARRDTNVFGNLMASRKLTARDELFDISRDASMLDNLAGRVDTSAYDKEARALFTKAVASPLPDQKVSPEELQRLRSLGYLQ